MNLKFNPLVKFTLGLLACLALPGCLNNETTITLNKDGSGTLVEETLLGAQALAMMTQFSEPGQPDPVEEMFKEDKAKANAAKLGEGVEYVKTEMLSKDGRKGARVHYKFADINKIKAKPGGALQDGMPVAPEEEDYAKFVYADGKLRIIVPPTDFNDLKMGDDDLAGEQFEQMKQMMADARMTLKLVVPDGIAETNASHVDGDTLTLFDVNLGKMLEQKDALKKIAETSKTDMDAAKAGFNKLEGIKAELKEEVTVTLK